MALERADFEALAHPSAGNRDAGRARVLDRALPAAVNATVGLFLSERRSALSSSLRTNLEALRAAKLSSAQALQLPVQLLRHGAHAQEADPEFVAASALLAWAAIGGAVEFEARFARSRRLRLDRWMTPPVQQIRASGQDGVLQLLAPQAPALVFDRSALDEALSPLPHVGVERAGFWLPEQAPSDALWADASPGFSQAPLTSVVQTLREAIELIRTHASEYLPWVERAIRTVVPIASTKTLSVSRSARGEHGIIWASFPCSVLHAAEVLIHEASHQYYYMTEHGVWMTNLLNDDRNYLSPYVQKQRRIDRILFAYHAFANVLLFHRQCGDTGRNADSQDMKTQAHQLAQVDRYLAESPGLTGAGRALYRALRERVGPLTALAEAV